MKKFLSILISFLIFAFFVFENAKAGIEHNVSGFAWSENIGWISFNNTSDGSTINYGVNINPATGKFSGYAWSENIGWISFNRSDTGTPPLADPCSDGSCIAKVENVNQIGNSNVRVLGWARALANGGGWDGWIRFDHGKSGEVYIDKDGNFHGWAWSDMVIGWISFNSSDPGAGGAAYKVVLNLASFNQPPTTTELTQSIDYCNIFAGQARVNFNWRYSDPNGDDQSSYSIEVQQLIGGFWVTKTLCENVPQSLPSGGIGSSAVYVKTIPAPPYLCPNDQGLEFGKQTRWRIKVFDSRGRDSSWSNWISFSIDSHAYPWVDFDWKPKNPVVNQLVEFQDLSTVYGGATKSSWYWEFENGNPPTSTIQNATTTFTSPGSKTVILKVTDSSGYSCSREKAVNISYPLPFWKEIPPIIWLKKFLAWVLHSLFDLF